MLFQIGVHLVKYPALIACPPQKKAENAIVTYILDPGEEKERIVTYIAQYLKLQVIHMTDVIGVEEKQRRWTMPFQKEVYNEDWLKYIYESAFFITDSFHGTCFGVIFKKQFAVIGNAYRGLARFQTILSKLGLLGRMTLGYDPVKLQHILDETIDYENVGKRMQAEIIRSREWLLHAVTAKERCAVSAYDIIQQDLADIYIRQMKTADLADAHGNVIGAHDARMQAYDKAFTHLFQENAMHQKVLMEQREILEMFQNVLTQQRDEITECQRKLFEQMERADELEHRLRGSFLFRILKKLKIDSDFGGRSQR